MSRAIRDGWERISDGHYGYGDRWKGDRVIRLRGDRWEITVGWDPLASYWTMREAMDAVEQRRLASSAARPAAGGGK